MLSSSGVLGGKGEIWYGAYVDMWSLRGAMPHCPDRRVLSQGLLDARRGGCVSVCTYNAGRHEGSSYGWLDECWENDTPAQQVTAPGPGPGAWSRRRETRDASEK